MTHLVLKVNLTKHYQMISELCELPVQLYNSSRVRNRKYAETGSVQIINSLTERCLLLKAGFRERKEVWFNPMNPKYAEHPMHLPGTTAAPTKPTQEAIPEPEKRTAKALGGWSDMDEFLGKASQAHRESRQTEPVPIQEEEDPLWEEIDASWMRNMATPIIAMGGRFKRQLFALGALAVLAVVAIGSAIYGVYELDHLASASEDDQDVNIKILEEHQTRIQIDNRSIHVLNKTLNLLNVELNGLGVRLAEDEMFVHLSLSMATVFDEYHRVERGLNAVTSNRITPDLLKTRDTTRAIMQLSKKMREAGYSLGLGKYEDLFECTTSHIVYPNGSMNIMIHIPAYKDASKLKIMEYTGMPITLTDGEKRMHMVATPERELLAVSEDEKWFRVLSWRLLNTCKKLSGVYFCSDHNIYDRREQGSCLMSLYKKAAENVADLCLFSTATAHDYAIQLGPAQFVIYQHEEKNVRLMCNNIMEGEVVFGGAHQVIVPAGCRLFTESFVLDGSEEYAIAINTYYARPMNLSAVLEVHGFDTAGFMASMKELELVGSAVGLTIKDISSRYRAHRIQTGITIGLTTAIGLVLVSVGAICFLRKSGPGQPGAQGQTNVILTAGRWSRFRGRRGHEEVSQRSPTPITPAPLASSEDSKSGNREVFKEESVVQRAKRQLEAELNTRRQAGIQETVLMHEN